MASVVPKTRDDLEYFEQVIEGEEVVVVHDTVRNTWFRFNLLQAAMLRSFDGKRTPDEIASKLSAEFDVEIPSEQIERFVGRTRDLMLLELGSYRETPARARKAVRKALRKAGFRLRAPDAKRAQQPMTRETELFAEAFRQLDHGHPRAAASYLQQVLAINPKNVRARQLYELVQTAYMKSFGGMTDYPTFVLFNPSRLLTMLSRKVGGFLFSSIGVIAIIAYLCIGLYAFSLITFDNITFSAFDIFFIYLFLTAGSLFHELGHGFACQHYGGNVTEIGYTLFFYFRLIPYCDTSSSYLIQSRRHKMIVQLAGSIATLIYSATMAIVLAVLAPTVPIYSALAVALILDSAFVFVGLIPLLKNDGYYAVADYLNFPNLRERSMKVARAWLAKTLFGIQIETEDLPARTRRRMIAFGIAARLGTMSFVLFMYLRFIVTPLVVHFRGAGLAFVLLLTAYLFRNIAIKPVLRSIATLVRERRKIFTVRRTAVLALLLGLVIGPWFLVKWPVLVDSEFVIVPAKRVDVRARIAGRVETILVVEGERVRAGQPIAILRNPELRTRIAVLEAEHDIAVLDLQRLETGARPEELALAKAHVATARAETNFHATSAARARVLASASLGTQSTADLAAARVAAGMGETGAAKADLSLLEAGARPEAIKMAQAELARIDNELAHLRSEAELLTLTSPIDGVVASRHVEQRLNENLAVGDLFTEIHDSDTLVAELMLKEYDPLDQIAVGDEVALKPYGVPGADVRVRITRFREAVEKTGEERQIVAVTSPFSIPHGIAGLTGHARVYGNEHSLAYANFYMPVQRIVRVRLWSLW